ncbi:MAG: outer membrane beta-barrel protein [Nitrospira sp.]|nr:outer membrane beta-barrel protein [Nitrospira sp.]
MTPQLRIDHSGHLVSGNLLATLTGESYAKNPGLNYIAPSGALTMNQDNLIGQLDRRAKLTVSDSFMFTPKPLAFIGPSTGSEVPDTFVRGIQAQRANSRTNMAMVTGAYLFTPSVSLQGSYTNSMMRFGTAFNAPNSAQSGASSFFNTSFQNYNIGPQFQITPLDSLSVNYQGSRAHFSQTRSSFSSKFETQGGTVGWKRTFTPTLIADASAGLTQIGTDANATLTYLANGSLEWKHEHGGAMLKYSRSVFPSFFVVAVPLLSQVITLSGTYGLSSNLSITGSANYARNESTGGQVQLSFDSYSTSMSLNYTITRSISAIASFTHSQFTQSFIGNEFSFNRNVVSLSLRGEWN